MYWILSLAYALGPLCTTDHLSNTRILRLIRLYIAGSSLLLMLYSQYWDNSELHNLWVLAKPTQFSSLVTSNNLVYRFELSYMRTQFIRELIACLIYICSSSLSSLFNLLVSRWASQIFQYLLLWDYHFIKLVY